MLNVLNRCVLILLLPERNYFSTGNKMINKKCNTVETVSKIQTIEKS